jgi:hypothetical protein
MVYKPPKGGPTRFPIPWQSRIRPYAVVNLSRGTSCTNMGGVKEKFDAKNKPKRATVTVSNQ